MSMLALRIRRKGENHGNKPVLDLEESELFLSFATVPG